MFSIGTLQHVTQASELFQRSHSLTEKRKYTQDNFTTETEIKITWHKNLCQRYYSNKRY